MQRAASIWTASIASIKERGILAGVALNPATPLQTVEYVLEKVDMVLIMTVNPGFGGQKFIPYTLQKVRDLKKMIDARGLKTDIEVDGGVNLSNVEEIMSAGANIIVAGSAVFNGDVAENTQMFLDILNSLRNGGRKAGERMKHFVIISAERSTILLRTDGLRKRSRMPLSLRMPEWNICTATTGCRM